jgi:hypothetical protein
MVMYAGENHHTFCRLLGALRDVDYIGRQRKGNEYRSVCWRMLTYAGVC